MSGIDNRHLVDGGVADAGANNTPQKRQQQQLGFGPGSSHHYRPDGPPPAAAPPPPPPGTTSPGATTYPPENVTLSPPQFDVGSFEEKNNPETSLPPATRHQSYDGFPLHQHQDQYYQGGTGVGVGAIGAIDSLRPPQIASYQQQQQYPGAHNQQPQQQQQQQQQQYGHLYSHPNIPLVRHADPNHPLANVRPPPPQEDMLHTSVGSLHSQNIPEEAPPSTERSTHSQSEMFHTARDVLTSSQINLDQLVQQQQQQQQSYQNAMSHVHAQRRASNQSNTASEASFAQTVDLSIASQGSGSSKSNRQQPPPSYQQGPAMSSPNPTPNSSTHHRRDSLSNRSENSYHLAYPQNNNGEEGNRGFVVHYEDEQQASGQRRAVQRVSAAGDASLAPNVGLTNSYDYALWGLAPHELLRFLQQVDSVASSASLVIASLSWLGKLIFLQLDKVVLLAYLAALSFVLLAVEITGMVTPEQQRLIPHNFMGRVRDQLGFLFQPWGKALFVLLLTTMCWGIGGIFLSLIGSVFFVSALGWFYAACMYTEDLPRLMGSIDATYQSETRRLGHARRTSFTVSTWNAIMAGSSAFMAGSSGAAQAARMTWTSLVSGNNGAGMGAGVTTSTATTLFGTEGENDNDNEDAEAGERTSLIPSSNPN